jgi:hypothetical protein
MEQRKATPTNNRQEGVLVRTHWLYDGAPQWARLDIDHANSEAKISFIRSENDEVTCHAKIKTGKPIKLSKSCKST